MKKRNVVKVTYIGPLLIIALLVWTYYKFSLLGGFDGPKGQTINMVITAIFGLSLFYAGKGICGEQVELEIADRPSSKRKPAENKIPRRIRRKNK